MIKIDLSDLIAKSKVFEKVIEQKVLDVTSKVTLDVHAKLVEASPVDTGTFRGNWTAETPTKPFQSGKVENNTEYGPALVNGHSSQAPSGWVDASIDAAVRL